MCRLPLWAVVGSTVTPSRRLRGKDDLDRGVYGVVQDVDSERVIISIWKRKKAGPEHIATYVLRFKDMFDQENPLAWHPDDWRFVMEKPCQGESSQLSLPGVDVGLSNLPIGSE